MTNFLPKGPRDAEAMIAEARKALWVMVGFIALIWVIQIINWADSYRLDYEFGIWSRDPGALANIIPAAFLHANWGHIEANSGPLFIFGFLAAYRGVRKFFAVSALILLASGLGQWFTGAGGTPAIGASGMVFGYLGYVIVRGIFDRHPIDIAIGLVMALSFAYEFSVLLPTAGIAWQAHAFGFAAGVLGGWFFRERRAKKPKTPAVTGPTPTQPLPGPTTTILRPPTS